MTPSMSPLFFYQGIKRFKHTLNTALENRKCPFVSLSAVIKQLILQMA